MDQLTQRIIVVGVIVIGVLCVGGMVLLASMGKPVEDALKIGAANILGILGGALGVQAIKRDDPAPPPGP